MQMLLFDRRSPRLPLHGGRPVCRNRERLAAVRALGDVSCKLRGGPERGLALRTVELDSHITRGLPGLFRQLEWLDIRRKSIGFPESQPRRADFDHVAVG